MLPLIYDELRRLAASYVRREKDKTLRPTELVHEAYLKLASGRPQLIADRSHVLALMATAMRQVLIDRGRARRAAKRGGGALRVTLTDALPARGPHEDALELGIAIERLHAEDERAAKLFVLHQYGGLKQVEIAALCGLSERTVQDDLKVARAWLHRHLGGGQKGAD